MSMIERVESQGQLLAIILRSEISVKGANFFTDSNNPIQLGVLQHVQGTELKPHLHLGIKRVIESIQEVLHIEYGEIEVTYFNKSNEKVTSSILRCGDTILLVNGGHGFKMLKDSKILEIKQGPYFGIEGDKAFLPGG